jgi:hypothetical protein
MNLPSKAVEVVNKMYEMNQNLAHGSEEQRRQLTKMIAEQLCFNLSSDWGTKSRDTTAPQSKDSIAFRINEFTMDVWDWQNGTTLKPQLIAGQPPTYPSLTGHHFIQVNPIDHIGGGTVPELDKLDKIIEILNVHTEILNNILNIKFPNYTTEIRGIGTIVLVPVERK